MTAKTSFSLLQTASHGDQSKTAQRQFQAEYGRNDQIHHGHSLYQLEDETLRPPAQKSAHWSIAWSDLMMTMFILFLSLFVYQAAHKDFLISDEHEVVAGDTGDAVESSGNDPAAYPFAATHPGAPLITSGTVKKVEPITLQEINLDEAFSDADMDKTLEELARIIPSAVALKEKQQAATAGPAAFLPAETPQKRPEPAVALAKTPQSSEQESAPIAVPPETEPRLAETTISTQPNQRPAAQILAQAGRSGTASTQVPELAEPVIEPQPLELATEEPGSVNDIFSRSRKTLDVHNLDQFASIDLVPDKAVRIVLTGDLLFEPGHAALSQQAIDSLEKIAEVIQQTTNTVHIEGHTDDVPIFAGRYANNWELSIARANAVANFLIEDMGMEPQQFVISGFSSYKPLAPNTTVQNRAANRRVEIVIAQPQKRQDIAFRETTNRAFQTL